MLPVKRHLGPKRDGICAETVIGEPRLKFPTACDLLLAIKKIKFPMNDRVTMDLNVIKVLFVRELRSFNSNGSSTGFFFLNYVGLMYMYVVQWYHISL